MGIHCPNNASIAEFVDALRRGDLTFHALPFNLEPELLDEATFLRHIDVAADLAKSLGLKAPTVMSQVLTSPKSVH
jgi:hypothetical protein